MKKRWGVRLGRLFLGGVFAYSGFMKLMEPAANFQAVLEHYPLLPAWALPFLAQTVPWAEWIFGMFLVVGYARRVSALSLGILSLGFIAALTGPVMGAGGDMPEACGCFGESGLRLSLGQAYLLDWICLALAGALFRSTR